MPRKKDLAENQVAPAAEPTTKKRTRSTKPAEVVEGDEANVSSKPKTTRTKKVSQQPVVEVTAPADDPTPVVEKPKASTRRKSSVKVAEEATVDSPKTQSADKPAVKVSTAAKNRKAAPVVESAEDLGKTLSETSGIEILFRKKSEADIASPSVQAEEVKDKRSTRQKRGKRSTAEVTASVAKVEEAAPVTPVVSETVEVGDLVVQFRGLRDRKPTRQKQVVVEEVKPLQVSPEPVELDAELFENFGIEMPTWRVSGAAKKPSQPNNKGLEQSSEESGQRDQKGRKRRQRGRGRDAQAVEGSETDSIETAEPTEVEVVFQPKPEPPKVIAKPILPIPDDAPQIVMRDGIPTLVRDHQVYPPIAFFGNTADESKTATVIQEIKMAGDAGIHLHNLLVEFEVDAAVTNERIRFAEKILAKVVEADPLAQVLFRVSFRATRGWEELFPDGAYRTLDGKPAEPSLSDDKFWRLAKSCLTEFVTGLRKVLHSKNIIGIHLDRSEWFLPQDAGYDISRAAKWKFRDWARSRYRNDIVALRAAWFDGDADFATLMIPPYPRDEENAPEKFVRANRKERRWVDYHLFLSDQTEARIAELAYAVKEASEGYFLVGASYGYTFEWSHPGSGHLSLGKMLRNPDIDFIAGPPSYKDREPGGSASFPGPIDSFALNGKLYISEEDFKTSIGTGYQPDDFNPVVKSPQALEGMHWRGVGSALSHTGGICWMDMWGNGWLKTPSVWDRAKLVRDALTRRMAVPQSTPDVAIFIDERSLAYLVDQKGFSLLVQNVRESVMRAGMSAAFYLLSDLQHRENFPESRLYVFLNAWDIRSELRAAIKNRLQKDGKVLFWLYTSALFDSGRESLERAREVTGIALRPQPFHSRTGTTILNRRHSLCEAFPEKTSIGGSRLEPSYFAIPEDGTVLGEYSQTGLPSFVLREFEPESRELNWKSVFLGEPIVTPALIRALGQIAGCQVWNFTEDVVHIRPPFLTVHCQGSGLRTIALPGRWSAYDLIEQEWIGVESTSLKFHATDGSTHCFLVGKREDLDQILTMNTDELLRMETLPVRRENTIRMDSFSFDVPIMNLNEWMEGSESEEIADDLLFKVRLIEEDTGDSVSEGNQVGRRRRKRRNDRSKDRDRTPRGIGEFVDFGGDDDSGMSVLFRKKD